MDDPGRVHLVERAEHLTEDPHRLAGREGAAPRQPLAEGLALEELHDHEGGLARGSHERAARHDVRVLQALHGRGLALEAPIALHVERPALLEQELEGDAALARLVDGRPHLAHPAAAELALESVLAPEHHARSHVHDVILP